MARDYSGLDLVADMSDDELQQYIVQQLEEYPNLDAGWIDVEVKDGFVTLSGTVGTDGEKQVAEEVVHDVVGVERYANELVVNELYRQELPEAADEAVTAEREARDQFGGDTHQQSDTASHLADDPESQAFGTKDMQQSVQEGTSYSPPDRPIPDGYQSEENH